MVKAIDNASTDKRIEGIYIDCKGASSGSATSLSIRNALLRFKESGKWIVAYGDAYTQSDYYM
ncbi:MAG: signal peptide peptidase SppA, partial [Muribaculaceae bacterium]|nr:signal peptide peptidase SppA [Muribaculaceae bacterium]